MMNDQLRPTMRAQRAGMAFPTMQNLVIENARLSRLLEQSKSVSSRYEIMLREGDHRIKNSLQIVASLLSLQARRAGSTETEQAPYAAAARIQCVARVHDALQLNGSNDVVDLGAMVEKMCESLQEMVADSKSIKFVVSADTLFAPLHLAQPIVLAVNELILNALRHAFPEGRSGSVMVTVKQSDGQVRLTIEDDGVGLPTGYDQTKGYGMRLIKATISKVGGTLDVKSVAGASFTLSAPLPAIADDTLMTARTADGA